MAPLSNQQLEDLELPYKDPFVEAQSEDEDDDSSSSGIASVHDEDDGEMVEWENPSYLVKDLDTGESYRVEEIEQHYTLVTLDSVDAQRGETSKDEASAENSSSSYLLSLYTADETADIEIENSPEHDLERTRSMNMSMFDEELEPVGPMVCKYAGCQEFHQRVSGYCTNHEIIAKEVIGSLGLIIGWCRRNPNASALDVYRRKTRVPKLCT